MRDQENLSYRRLRDFPGPRPWIRSRHGPVVDLSLACRSCLAGVADAPFSGGRSARPRRRRNLGFIWPICNTGDRHTGSGFSDAAFGYHRTISLCPKSDIRGGCEHHPWSGLDLRERQAARIRRACLAFLSPRCADLRRTNPNGEFWFRVRGLLCRGPAVDSPPHPMDSSSGRVKAYGEAGQTGVGGDYSLLVAQRRPITLGGHLDARHVNLEGSPDRYR